MGLLDNLFKPKPESGGEKSVESASGESGAEHAAATTKAQFLAPKIYVPRSSVQIVPPVKTAPQGERRLAPVAEPASGPKEIVLTLGDVLSRIPAHFLREGRPDLRRELRFPAEGLAADIAHGRAGVYLAEIVAQCPDLFLPEVNGFDDIQIRLPLQKLVEQIALGGSNHTPVARTTLAPAPEPAASEELPIPSVPSPVANPAPPAAQDEVQIHLSLAAIMRRCPREIIVQPLPPIEEAVRITFPFAPIERQLSTGQVEVSSLRFIAALPLGLMKCFEAKAGVKVPLPLEEIFQNLPNQAPRSGVESRFLPSAAAQAAPTESADHSRENSRLAESILLEPMFEPVRNAEPDSPASEPTAPPVAENVVINANFAPEPPAAPAREIREPVSTAPPPPLNPESVKTGAALELEAQLEALAAEDAKIESRLAEDELLAPPPASRAEEKPEPVSKIAPEPVEEKLVPVSEIQPQPAPPPVESVANIPAPPVEQTAPPVGLSAFRPFAPALRPPVILQQNSGPGELRPLAEIPAPVSTPTPEPPDAFELPPETPAPTSAIVAPMPPPPIELRHPPAPVFSDPVLPSSAPEHSPAPETVVEKALPFAAEPAPVPAPPLAEVSATTLRIGPPQFRPFVVHAPPIVFAPAETSAAAQPQPVIAESVEPSPPEPVAETSPELPEPTPETIVEPPVENHPEPLPDFSAFHSASPLLLDGRVREFFQSDAPLPLPRVSQLLASLPGIHGCILITRAAESHSGQLPGGLDPAAIRDLSQRMRGALADRAENFGSGEVQHLTLHAEHYSLSLFTRGEACACAVHRARIFLPGVREKFAAVAEELARASH